MHQAVEAQNGPDLQREAHTLKGGGRDLGTPRLVEICQIVEERGKAASFDGVPELLKQIERELEQACVELKKYLDRREV